MIRFDDVTKIYPGQTRPALDDVSLEIEKGEFVFLVGTSGSGKSTFLKLVLREEKTSDGRIHVLGKDLSRLSQWKIPVLRRQVGTVFQDFRLLPNKTVAENVAFALEVIGRPEHQIAKVVPEVLELVGLAGKEDRRPDELSGGEQQRVAIARAFVNKPMLLIADEPTTALDVTIQAQILDLMADLKNKIGAAIVLITHDLGVVAEVAERVMVMYAGRKVEEAPVGELFAHPLHPYTQGLLGAVPKLGASLQGHTSRLKEIPGLVPSLKQKIKGCVFASRCPLAIEPCHEIAPAMQNKGQGHLVACHFAGEMAFAND